MTTPARRMRVPMFAKFLAACLLLAGILIIGGTIVFKNESALKNRGTFLMKQLRRYQTFQERSGRALTEAVEIAAGDVAVRQALGSDPATPEARNAFRQLWERVVNDNGVPTDVFLIYDGSGKLIWAPDKTPIDGRQLASLAAVEKTRLGTEVLHQIQVVDHAAYQISAVPVRAATGDTIVGGVLLGVRVQRLVDDYAKQSDDDPNLRYRPALVDGTTLYASAIPGDATDVLHALQPDKYVRVTLGDDTREVIRLKDADYDFYAEEQDGYRNTDAATVGRLVIARSRASLVDPAATLPWFEIGIGIVFSLAIAFGLGLWVTRPIKQMVRQSSDLLAGDTDLTQRIVVSTRDEIADLADNINQVFARVHALATGVQGAAFQVGASSAEISAASRTMLTGLKDQTQKIESSTTAVTELSASIQQVAGNAAQATTVAATASTAVASAVQRMEQIQVAVDDAAGKMKELGESSKRIGNIVEVIRQISEQTSMLALNASIEAAHAGDQGRGFAVVADEVSSLARRVGQSAKDIEALIQTVKEQTQAAMASMEVGTREVVGGSQLVTSTLTGLGELITVVNETANAVQEQAVVSDEIARNMDAVRHIATEVLGGSEESVVQSERLHELAFELEESIGGFNLDGSKPKQLPKGPSR